MFSGKHKGWARRKLHQKSRDPIPKYTVRMYPAHTVKTDGLLAKEAGSRVDGLSVEDAEQLFLDFIKLPSSTRAVIQQDKRTIVTWERNKGITEERFTPRRETQNDKH